MVVRANDGAVRAFHNVCRHRGTRLCNDQHGAFQGSIQCPYPAWTYGLDGRLIAAPQMDEVSGFDRGVALLAEGAPGSAPPTRARVALVNGLAPDRLLYLADFETPLQLTSSPVVVVAQ